MNAVVWVALASIGFALGACAPKREPQATPEPAPALVDRTVAPTPAAPSPAAPGTEAAEPQRFGEPLAPAQALDLGQLLSAPQSYAAQEVTVEGVVRQVCQARGCWLELAEATAADAKGCRVVMKDHAFFVPTDSAGRRVRVQGRADVKRVPAAQVAHMEQEGGRFSNKQPDGSAHELRIVARGVELLPDASM